MTHQDWYAIWLSLKVAFFSTLLIVPPGIALGWLFARRVFKGKAFLEAATHIPLVLPPVVTGYLLLVVFGRQGWLGYGFEQLLGVTIAFNTPGVILASAVVAFPLMVRSAKLGFELTDERLEIAASTLGATPFRVFRKVTLPLAFPGVLAGMVLGFVRSLGEFGATITFAGNIEGKTRTLPLAVYTYLQIPGREQVVWLLSIMAIALSLAALLVSESLNTKLRMRTRGRI